VSNTRILNTNSSESHKVCVEITRVLCIKTFNSQVRVNLNIHLTKNTSVVSSVVNVVELLFYYLEFDSHRQSIV
jgi:hypothetical protein